MKSDSATLQFNTLSKSSTIKYPPSFAVYLGGHHHTLTITKKKKQKTKSLSYNVTEDAMQESHVTPTKLSHSFPQVKILSSKYKWFSASTA